MKKRNNKVIVLALAGVIFVSLLVVFILNYSKDDSSFSILEKKWINDNASSVIDVSIYNDIPIYGKNGSGVSFDLLDSFSEKYGINFNKVSYLVNDSTMLLIVLLVLVKMIFYYMKINMCLFLIKMIQ